ncbi:MAG: ATP-binding protein [Polyangiales bacterium]|nr:MASE1 domain-containing protein [Myxococcales bacterium]
MFAGYVVGGVLGLRLSSVVDAVTLVWPPTGIAIAAVVVYGRAMVPVVWLGALAVNLLARTDPRGALFIATGNALEALCAGYLLQRTGFSGRFDVRREVRDYAALASLLAPLASALVGASALVVSSAVTPSDWPRVLALWWAGDATGALIVGPLALTWLRPGRRVPAGHWGVAVLLIVCASVVAFGTPGVPVEFQSALLLLPIMALAWAALELGPRGAATGCALVCSLAVAGTAIAHGPLASPGGALAPGPLWLFMTSAGVLSLLLTSLNAERGTAEAATRASQARFASAFDHAPIGMAILGSDGAVVDANPQMARMLATTTAAMVGQPVTSWLETPIDAVREATAAARPLDPPPCVSVVDARGQTRSWNARVTAVPLGREEQALLLQAEDVTDAQANAASLRALNEQLVHAQRMDSVGNLAGGIAHDFNNLLQAIGANLELARLEGTKGSVRAQALSGASDAVQRAATLTSRLLAFSHRSPVQRVPVDLNKTLARARDMLARLLPEDVTLDVQLESEPAYALADETQLEQVLMNLCVNARDAMPAGGRITLRLSQTEDRIVLSACDEGPGIPADLRARVFEPFFTTKERGRGTGFGLSIVFGIVRAHDGDIRIEDAPGGGACVRISLPRTDERPVETERPPRASTSAPLRVLMAEDEPLVRDALVQMLEGEGHTVLAAEDGAAALERFSQEQGSVDVLLFDVRMPRMTGPAALRAIRARERHFPAVLMSGYSGDELDVGSGDLASVELLEKPFELSALNAALTRATRGHARQTSQPTAQRG